MHYDPAFAYEISHIMRSGLERMYGDRRATQGENVIFYLTVYNEPVTSRPSPTTSTSRACCAACTGSPWPMRRRASRAAAGLRRRAALGRRTPPASCSQDWGVTADTWSVTSWNELARDAVAAEDWNLLHTDEAQRTPYVTEKLAAPTARSSRSPTTWPRCRCRSPAGCPGDYCVLGADGFGFADTRPAARRYFRIDAQSVVVRALQALADAGEIDPALVAKAAAKYRIDDPTAVAGVKQEGGDA